MTARITYNSVNIDLDILQDTLDVRHKQTRHQNRAGDGGVETINQYGLWEISFKAHVTQAVYYSHFGFWSWARHGKPFSFAVDNTLAVATTLDAAAASGQAVIPLTATTGLTVGDYCMIEAADNYDEFEVIQINSISTGDSVTAASNLVYPYNSGDIFRHIEYWSSLVADKTTFNPRERKGTTRYEHTFTFVEAPS